jgi:hypothetical protein
MKGTKHKYRITLTVKGHTHKPQKIHKYKTVWDIAQAWEYARKECSNYNKSHKSIAVITGVAKN